MDCQGAGDVIGMGDFGSAEHFLNFVKEFIIASILMLFGYLFGPLELINKYKYAMPNEIELLIFSTGILVFLAGFTLSVLNERRTNQGFISDRGIKALVVLNFFSFVFFIYTANALKTAFSNRHDPQFNYFFWNNYLFYAIAYFSLIFILSWISGRALDRLKSI
jgi:hypothetical protein